jgi:hypothetical protein
MIWGMGMGKKPLRDGNGESEENNENIRERKKIDWVDVIQKTLIAVLTAAVLGAGTLVWNNVSSGGLVRALGGVTKADVNAIMAGGPSQLLNAVVPFDGVCPPGWLPARETVGATIVGAGALLVPENGSPSTPGSIKGGADDLSFHTPGPQAVPRVPGTAVSTFDQSAIPISHYVFGIKTAVLPQYLPLYFCKKVF